MTSAAKTIGKHRLGETKRAITMAGMKVPRKLGRRLWLAHLGFQDHEGMLSAAGIAYYVALSFFPLLMVLVAGLGSVLQWTAAGQDAQQSLLAAIEQQASPDLAQQVERMLNAVKERAPPSGPIGFVVLVVSAIVIFAQLDTAFDRIWRLPVDPHATWRTWIGAAGVSAAEGARHAGRRGRIHRAGDGGVDGAGRAIEQALEPRIELGPWLRWAYELVDQSAAELDRRSR